MAIGERGFDVGVRAALVGVLLPGALRGEQQEHLDELGFLLLTAGGKEVCRFTQSLSRVNARTYIGQGKVQEIARAVKEQALTLVVFDDELTPSQQRNLEDDLACQVIDRTGLILDIFAQRAQTSYAKKQVELAQYEYLLPRLAGLWTHLERQQGGIGLRGPGEREIETDRRRVRKRITRLKKELLRIDKQMAVQRKHRDQLVRISLVGYTNVGKSTLMNCLTDANILAENKLFATLDTTVRQLKVGGIPCLLSDTVGFIRKLPTQLIEAFNSTLDEVREADLLIHVVDISHPRFEDQVITVNETLRQLEVSAKPQVLVFNKIDAYRPFIEWDDTCLLEKPREAFTLEELQNTWMGRDGAETLFISAQSGEHVDTLLQTLHRVIKNEVIPTRGDWQKMYY